MPVDTIRIEGLTVDCVVGVYPRERDTPQPLTVDVALRLDTERAATRERMHATVHYGAVAAQIELVLQSCRFHMLETAAHALAKLLLAPPARAERRAQVESLSLTLTKPRALGGNGVPSLTVEREAGWVTLGHEKTSFGTVDVVHETKDAGIYRLNVAPRSAIPLHLHRTMHEVEMVLTDGLRCQGRDVVAGSVFRWPLGAPHVYDNPTSRTQTILCVDSPPFDARDEVRVEGEPADVAPELPPWAREPGG